jgi:MoxR-like ATPase
MSAEQQAKQFRDTVEKVRTEVGKVFVGQQQVLTQILQTVFAGGNGLLEGVPGLGKTLLVRTLSRACSLSFKRIQFTPDLMPADIVGTNIIMEDAKGHKEFQFQPGPIFAQIVLADEINRATPKTQSALLEAMQEHAVTSGGRTFKLKEPFFVLATQNPIEMEGTYPLPEAQVDRFLAKIQIGYPPEEELSQILERTTGSEEYEVQKVIDGEQIMELRGLCQGVPIASHVRDLVTRTLYATHPDSKSAPDMIKKYVRYGASPRGGQALIKMSKVASLMEGRFNVAAEDIEKNLLACLRHRIILSFEGEAEGIKHEDVIAEAFAAASK